MRWLLIGSVGIYIVPITFYIVLFGRGHILCEVILGAFSFLFFGPTYLNILNIYSLCRIDDISWGTKGLDSGSNKNANLKDSWKQIKFVHVVKYVLWNVILGAVLLTLGSNYVPRFFVTIIMVALIGLTISLKVLLACMYMLIYWCKYVSKKPNPVINSESRIGHIVDDYKESIMREVKDHLEGVKQ
jgi:chitin synthase